MVYIRNGAVVERRKLGLWAIPEFLMVLINFVVVFFRTIFDPAAAAGIKPPGGGKRGGGGNGRGGGGGGGGGRGGRIVGMDNLQADHTARCGGGG